MILSPSLSDSCVLAHRWHEHSGPASSQKPLFFLDMDEVLVDFSQGVRTATGLNYPPQTWLDESVFESLRHQAYSMIESQGEAFWRDLPPRSDTFELLDGLQKHDHAGFVILTAWPRHWDKHSLQAQRTAQGKKAWIEQHLQSRGYPVHSFFCVEGPQKSLYAHPDYHSILIDDLGSNIQRWKQHVPWGHGIEHVQAGTTLDLLKHHLQSRHTPLSMLSGARP